VAVGSDVRGYTKKGKLFLDFGTNLTESIESMSISGSHLLTCGNHVYNHYLDCRDTNYFLSEDVITDVLALPGEKVSSLKSINGD
jgi:Bardet-Biedl syndrome 7 protein